MLNKNWQIYLILISLLLVILIVYLGSLEISRSQKINLEDFLFKVKNQEIKKITLSGETEIIAETKEGKILRTSKDPDESLTQILKDYGIPSTTIFSLEIKKESTGWKEIGIAFLFNILPFLLVAWIFWQIFRQAQRGAGQIFDFTKVKAKLFGPGSELKEKITFEEIGGLKEAKEEIKEIVDFLKNPEKYRKIGAKIPRGVLLMGPPGTGKTLLAKAIASTAGVPFFSISASEIMELFVGVGASRIRNLFTEARKVGRAIIFIDEIDSIGRVRGPGITGAHEEREQTLNQLLSEMDGIGREENLIVIGASVTGDTPVLVKQKGKCKLLPISQVIDPYYREGEEGVEKAVTDLEILGFEKRMNNNFLLKNRLYFGNSAFKKARSVFRHKVKEIYEIEYLGGKIKTTGNHSVFVRTQQGLKVKRVSELKSGEILVDLPFKVNSGNKKLREIRAHKFNSSFNLELDVWQPLFQKFESFRFAYDYSLINAGKISQSKLGKMFGVSQTTIGHWQRGIYFPRSISKNYYQHKDILPKKVKVTPELMRLFGYYVAEGYARKELDFCFNINEKEKIEDLKKLMKKIFNILPSRERKITPNALNIVYHCKPLSEFFAYYCGKGAKNKHAPYFLFEAPFKYFKEFLRGCFAGDGYFYKNGRIELTSVSKQLILELNWLCRMHGFKSYITSFKAKGGRKINNGKSLKETIAWRLGLGKTQNPLLPQKGKASTKRAIIKSIKKIPYDGYVYDFCHCENEAFWGGESPILLHNTNRPELLDPALLRPGRFDRKIVLELPDIKAREEILKIHLKDKKINKVNVKQIAERTPGFSGADLANLCNEAAILAARKNKEYIEQKDLLDAIEKVLLGPERKTKVYSKKEKEIAAYHEAGHALVAHYLKYSNPVQKISIIARGRAGGYTLKLPTEEKSFYFRKEFLDELASLLGGYAAEKLIFKDITTGASNDLEVATDLARQLVIRFGMSEKLGPVSWAKLITPFLGREFFEKEYSEKTAEIIDEEVKNLINQALERATKVLEIKKDKLEKLAQTLIKKEVLEKKQFEKIVGEPKGSLEL